MKRRTFLGNILAGAGAAFVWAVRKSGISRADKGSRSFPRYTLLDVMQYIEQSRYQT